MRRGCLISLMAAVGLAAGAGCASGGKNWWQGSGQEGSWGVELLVDGGALPVFEQSGRSWVEGRWGQRYVLRIHNRTAERIEVVVSVDGRDVIDGRPADEGKRGYVIGPWSWADIDGWRLSMHEVAAFRFTHPGDAYASRMGSDPDDLGVIKVAVFEEDRPETPEHGPIILGTDGVEASADMRAAPSARKEANLGTRFGERRQSAASGTDFERASSWPAARLALRYDDAAGLCDRGLKRFCGPGPIVPIDRRRPDGDYSDPPPGWDGHRGW